MFGGAPERNMANPWERGIATTWLVPDEDAAAKPRNIKWQARLGTKAFAGPVIADGRVFIGTNNQRPRNPGDIDPMTGRPIDKGVLMCFREADGKFLWQATHAKLASGRVNDWPLEGLPSMPAVDGNRLFYVSNRCELICADTRNGNAIWRLDMFGQLNVFPHNLAVCAPLVVGDLVFVVTGNGVDEDHITTPSPAAPSFIAVHKRTGKVVWQNNAPTAKLLGLKLQGQARLQEILRLRERGELLMHAQWSSPSYTDVAGQPQVIFPGGDGWLCAFVPETGRLLWKFDCNPKASRYGVGGRGTRSDFIAAPIVHAGRLYIGVGQDPEHNPGVGHLWCIDLARAVAKGRTNNDHDVSPVGDNFDPAVAVNCDSALAWHYGGMVASKEERARLQRSYYFSRTLSSCAVHDGLVYAADLLGILHCLDAATGKHCWTHDTGKYVWSSPYYVDGKVYLGTDDDVVWVFGHGRQKRILAKNEMPAHIRGPGRRQRGAVHRNREYVVRDRQRSLND